MHVPLKPQSLLLLLLPLPELPAYWLAPVVYSRRFALRRSVPASERPGYLITHVLLDSRIATDAAAVTAYQRTG